MIRHGVVTITLVAAIGLAPGEYAPAPANADPLYAVPVEPADTAATPPMVAAFLEAINRPSPESIRGFEDVHASELRRGRATHDDRLERMRGLNTEFGRLTLRRTVSQSARAVVVTVDSERVGPVELTFELNADQPGKVDAIAIAAGAGAVGEPIDAAGRDRIIDGALAALEEGYVFPEVGLAMADAVNARRAAGEYDSIDNDAALVRRLTQDLQAVSKDKHLNVRISPSGAIGPRAMGPGEEEMRRENYGFKKVERLDGNIGYLRFDVFVATEEARAKARAAMEFLADCDAIIFDLRHNGGGSPEMIQYLSSFLFAQRTHLNSMIDRDGNVVEEYWTLESAPGRRVPETTKLFVLTSGRTFSGAEEFSYNLKNLKRATIIGETTGGGAHPIRGHRVSDRVIITVPFMRAHNPITKTNWEGTGVEPDVKCAAADALDKALELARGRR